MLVVLEWQLRYRLTDAEAAILRLCIEGCSQLQIAHARRVTVNTVKTQTRSLLEKTGDDTLRAAALRAARSLTA